MCLVTKWSGGTWQPEVLILIRDYGLTSIPEAHQDEAKQEYCPPPMS